MKIVSCNLNGIRSAHRKGFFDWYKKQKCDVLCLQELKAQEDQIDVKSMFSKNIHSYFKCAAKKGYSGVSIHTKIKPDNVIYEYGDKEFDDEGRYIEVQLNEAPDNEIKENVQQAIDKLLYNSIIEDYEVIYEDEAVT